MDCSVKSETLSCVSLEAPRKEILFYCLHISPSAFQPRVSPRKPKHSDKNLPYPHAVQISSCKFGADRIKIRGFQRPVFRQARRFHTGTDTAADIKPRSGLSLFFDKSPEFFNTFPDAKNMLIYPLSCRNNPILLSLLRQIQQQARKL